MEGGLEALPAATDGRCCQVHSRLLIVPALILLAGLPVESAVGTSLFIIALQSLAGAAGYMRHASADAQVVGVLATAMAGGSIGGGLLSQRLRGALLRRLFALLLLASALFMLLRNLR